MISKNMGKQDKLKVLVAEDSPTQSEQLRFVLENHNYEVVVAKDGEEAMALVIKKKPDVVISDIIMPEMNGYELCRKIKGNENTKNIPVILLTSLFRSEDILECLECGADSFINKPYSENYLISHLEKSLNESKINLYHQSKSNIKVSIDGELRSILIDPAKMMAMMISTYEAALSKNIELIHSREELSSLNENLEELVNERTAELSKINAEKDKFFSIIAHDLRSPLQGLLSLTKMMADVKENFTLSDLTGFSKALNESADNLYQLLGNLLEWAMIQKGATSFEPKELNLSAIVLQNIRLLKERLSQKGISMVNGISYSQTIHADEKMAETIMRNLISNSVKFTKSGGTVTVKSEKNENGMVEISVSDTGVGISEDKVKKLFILGEKIGTKGTDGELSTGLGLILCKEFVEKHGGRLWVESEVDKGSTFRFTMPAGSGTTAGPDLPEGIAGR